MVVISGPKLTALRSGKDHRAISHYKCTISILSPINNFLYENILDPKKYCDSNTPNLYFLKGFMRPLVNRVNGY